tara:strand:+ start:20667 stop:21197 length:531 start_codon:yes stop_codon:yes gene_type:complete
MPLSTIASNQIKQNTIVDANINSSANIATTKLGTGAIVQVVFSRVAVNSTVITSSSYADIPQGGHQITITPNFSNSKILVNFLGSRMSYTTTNGNCFLQLHRSIGGGSFSFLEQIEANNYNSGTYGYSRSQAVFDEPNTTSAVIYKMMGKSTGTGDAHYTGYGDVPATLTAMEIRV